MTDAGGGQILGERFLAAMREATRIDAASGEARARLAHVLRVSGLVLGGGGDEDEVIGAIGVSLADNLDHLRGSVAELRAESTARIERRGRPATDAGAYYAGLARAFARRQPTAETDELDQMARLLDRPAEQSAAADVKLTRAQTRPAVTGGRTRPDAARTTMTSVGIRELAANVSAVVADVARSGRPAVVTKHGAPVAALIPIADLEDLLQARASREAAGRGGPASSGNGGPASGGNGGPASGNGGPASTK